MDIKTLSQSVEAVSKSYATKHQIERSDEWLLLKLSEEVGELTQSFLKLKGQARIAGASQPQLQQDFESEVADVLGQILLIANRHNVDVEAAMQDKWLRWIEK